VILMRLVTFYSPMKPKKKSISISKLKRKADAVFSLWVRARDKRCVTCNSTYQLQNGHFVSRNHNSTRYDERNNNAQCAACNIWKNGNMAKYALYLQNKYGPEIIKDLVKQGEKLKQFKRADLEEIIKKYAR